MLYDYLGFLASSIYMEEVTSKEMRGTFITFGGVCRWTKCM